MVIEYKTQEEVKDAINKQFKFNSKIIKEIYANMDCNFIIVGLDHFTTQTQDLFKEIGFDFTGASVLKGQLEAHFNFNKSTEPVEEKEEEKEEEEAEEKAEVKAEENDKQKNAGLKIINIIKASELTPDEILNLMKNLTITFQINKMVQMGPLNV